uniref:Integrin subunit alpha E n=1 Tax=Molossus molossus TaxID=27622 RepID=A0A7J8CYW6_MOLMO|nr:integrin subunit alpha E [Molossus molossus]
MRITTGSAAGRARGTTAVSLAHASRGWLSFQANTVCTQSQERACGSDPNPRVQEWHSVSCAITSDKENVTVAAELSVSQSKQILRDVTELQILGEISFNKSLYEGLNAENHKTKVTVIFLKEEEYLSLPVIIGSSVAGLLVLIVIIIILFKCGFFKRKYRQLNLESIRKAQLKSENLLTEGEDQPHPLGGNISQSLNSRDVVSY